MSASEELLREIEHFLSRPDVGLSETGFGKAIFNDGKFIPNLRAGRRVWPETAEKARAFMRDFKRTAQGAAA